MEYTLEERYEKIRKAVLQELSRDPVKIAQKVMEEEFVSIHGPEHHFLDGACLLCAYRNAGGEIDLEKALDQLAERSRKMPGAMCGHWGVCGACASVGAALAVLHGTGPLTEGEAYACNMQLTSAVLKRMAAIGGPRCCKRNAFLSLGEAARFLREHDGIPLECGETVCGFSARNRQCIGSRCPFHRGE